MPTHHPHVDRLSSPPVAAAQPLRATARVLGLAFLAAGILGFVPGVTAGSDTLQAAGRESEAMLLGLFQVSVLHNLVHLAFGVVGLVMARTSRSARTYLLLGGAVYLGLWVQGLVIDSSSEVNLLSLNGADDWLHLVLGAGMVALALLTTLRREEVGHREA